MRSINAFVGTGEISEVSFGETLEGKSACNFLLLLEKSDGYHSRVRVNVYGIHVDFCRSLFEGDRVFVQGEFMNRKKSGSTISLAEVRCLIQMVISLRK